MKRPYAACRYVCGSLAAVTDLGFAYDCYGQYIIRKL